MYLTFCQLTSCKKYSVPLLRMCKQNNNIKPPIAHCQQVIRSANSFGGTAESFLIILCFQGQMPTKAKLQF